MRIEAVEFAACLFGGEAPVDGGLVPVALLLPGPHFFVASFRGDGLP